MMQVERIAVDNSNPAGRERWLALRERDVTASVVGALRGLHPYTSRLRLYKQHTGFEFPKAEGVRLERGLLLEMAVAARVAQERPDWKIEQARYYLRAPEHRLGATPDFIITDATGRVGVLQTKLSIAGVFEKAWRDELGNVIPPMWIRLQALTEAMLWGADFGAIAVYIDHPFRNEVYIFEFERHPGAEATIIADVAQFWHDVEWEIEPDPDGSVDAELVRLLYKDGRLDENEVMKFAINEKFDETNAAIACLAHVPVSVVESMMIEASNEGILIMSKVANFSWPTVKAIIDMRQKLANQPLSENASDRDTYERLRPSTAQQVLRFHRMQQVTADTSVA